MKRHSAVLFPDTVPNEQVLFPLVQVFQPIVYCLPVENEPAEQEKQSPLPEEFFSHSLCRRVFPAPLGPDRDRFMRLISDLRYRGDDYAAQLANVTLASIGTTGDTETKGTILSNLLNSHGIRQVKPDRKTMILWQSRLILKLGELYDENQQILRDEMARIRERERGLIEELRRESEHSYMSTEKLFSGSVEDEDQQRLRLKAWARVFTLGQNTPEGCRIFVTADKDACDRLAEEYERVKGAIPEKLNSLPLPARPAGDEIPSIEQVQRFSKEAEVFHEQVGLLLHETSTGDGLTERMDKWEQLLEQYYPAPACGRRQLDLYRFAQISARSLFLGSFGHDDDIRLLEKGTREDSSGILIGVLS